MYAVKSLIAVRLGRSEAVGIWKTEGQSEACPPQRVSTHDNLSNAFY